MCLQIFIHAFCHFRWPERGGAYDPDFSVHLSRSRANFHGPEILYIFRRNCYTSQADSNSSFPSGMPNPFLNCLPETDLLPADRNSVLCQRFLFVPISWKISEVPKFWIFHYTVQHCLLVPTPFHGHLLAIVHSPWLMIAPLAIFNYFVTERPIICINYCLYW